jgi:mono/diheme cytochrome c family protein/glucose/arabinose dehydrogenase
VVQLLALPRAIAAETPNAGATKAERPWWEKTGNPRGQWWLTAPSYQGAAANEIWKRVEIPPSPVLSPDQALKSFRLAPGFRIELVAAEPMIVQSVHMQFDAAGRLWVVEMPGYMRDIDGAGEDDPSGRLVVLEDTDGDGRMDKSTTFLDGLIMPRTVSFVAGGVLVAEPPRIWFAQDLNGDLVADKKTIVATDYGEAANPEHSANGLLRAIDNWMYSAKSAVRYRFADGTLTPERTFFRGQWGITQDDTGRLYYNYNSTPLHTEVFPAEYLARPGTLDVSRSGNFVGKMAVNLPLLRDAPVYPVRVTPLVTLGASDLSPEGKLRKYSAACGPLIYRGDAFPEEFRGNAFICDPVGNFVSRFLLDAENPGADARKVNAGQEFLASVDERFRPVFLQTGPDGALYVADLYTPRIEHKRYVTDYLRDQVLGRNLNEFTASGRIYRIVAENSARRATINLERLAPADWVKQLSADNGWIRDTAQRLLVDAGDRSVIPALLQKVQNGASALGRLHALWTIEGLGRLEFPTVLLALRDRDPRMQVAALRLSERFLPSQGASLAKEYARLAENGSADVRRQVLLSLGQAQTDWAMNLLVSLLAAGGDAWQPSVAAVALAGREERFIPRVLDDPAWSKGDAGQLLVLKQLGIAVMRGGDQKRIPRLLSALEGKAGDKRAVAFLYGVASVRRNAPPIPLPARPTVIAALAGSARNDDQQLAKALSEQFNWGQARPPKAAVAKLTPEEQTRVEMGRAQYALVCAACHQPGGEGLPAVAPSLVGSSWVNGSADVVIKIVLHGLTGPVTVNGEEWNMTMPGFAAAFDDEKIAAIATYIRREWGNQATAVLPAQVAALRRENASRSLPWTGIELQPPASAGHGAR